MILRALAVWLVILVVAIATATAREMLLAPRVGAAAAHVVGTLSVVVLALLVIWLTVRWIVPSLEPARLLRLGMGWTALTVAFEFGFGRLVMGHPWSALLHDYNVFAGRIWILVLLTTLFGPWLLGRTRRRSSAEAS